MNKILYIDTETGGLDFEKSALIQLSGIIEVDNKEQERFNFHIKPADELTISEEALNIQGLTSNDFNDEKFKSETEVFNQFIKILDKYVDKYNKEDKFIIAGYNVQFDVSMLESFFKRNKNNFLYSYISNVKLDPLNTIPMLQVSNQLPILKNNKLGTWCDYFDIELDAHDSMNDIVATKKLLETIKEVINVGREIVDADSIVKKIETYRKQEEKLNDEFCKIAKFSKYDLNIFHNVLPIDYRPSKRETWDFISPKIISKLLELKKNKEELLKLGFKIKDTRFEPTDWIKTKNKTETIFNKYKKLFESIEKYYL